MQKIATVEDFRNRPILINVPDTDLQILCRRPDPLALIADGVLPLPMFADVLEQLNNLAQQDTLDNRSSVASIAEQPRTYLDFVDRWVCAAAVSPKFVVTEEEALADPAGVLWVQDLELAVRLEIVRRTSRPLASARVRTAVTDFRRQRFAGAGAGSDGTAVRGEAVAAVAGA